MTLIDRYLILTAKEVEKSDAEAQRPMLTTFEQRVAVALCEARAVECRHWATELRIRGTHPVARDIANAMDKRADKLQKKAIEMCGKYPPTDTGPETEPKGMVTLQ